MNFDTQTAAGFAQQKLDLLLIRAVRDTREAIEGNDVPKAVAHFAELKATVKKIAARVAELEKHLTSISYDMLPTMFANQDVKTIAIDGVGRATLAVRWSASMREPEFGLQWLRHTGNEGIIKEYVHHETLAAFSKAEFLAGRPLPDDIFKVSSVPYIHVTPAK